jgi:hypothetical protein
VTAPSHILAIDPGLVHPGAAIYVADRLICAQRVRVPGEWAKLGVLDRCEKVADQVVAWARFSHDFWPALLVVEWPQWYRETKSGGKDPNDLAALCGIAGAALGRLRAAEPGILVDALSPKPREVWGNLPKATKGDPWKSPRARRLASRLRPVERAGVQDYHDALDAAGLALWAAGRWQARRVYPGAE